MEYFKVTFLTFVLVPCIPIDFLFSNGFVNISTVFYIVLIGEIAYFTLGKVTKVVIFYCNVLGLWSHIFILFCSNKVAILLKNTEVNLWLW